jgi:hypothetical protein
MLQMGEVYRYAKPYQMAPATSPHKIGSKQTPWHDIFDSDNGHILYFGDEKTPGHDPAKKACLQTAGDSLIWPWLAYPIITRAPEYSSNSRGFNGRSSGDR